MYHNYIIRYWNQQDHFRSISTQFPNPYHVPSKNSFEFRPSSECFIALAACPGIRRNSSSKKTLRNVKEDVWKGQTLRPEILRPPDDLRVPARSQRKRRVCKHAGERRQRNQYEEQRGKKRSKSRRDCRSRRRKRSKSKTMKRGTSWWGWGHARSDGSRINGWR